MILMNFNQEREEKRMGKETEIKILKEIVDKQTEEIKDLKSQIGNKDVYVSVQKIYGESSSECDSINVKVEQQMKVVYLLLADFLGTPKSRKEHFGVAVASEECAEKFVQSGGIGVSRSYAKIYIFDNEDDMTTWLKGKER